MSSKKSRASQVVSKSVVTAALALSASAAAPAIAKDGAFRADPAKSKVQWIGSKVIGSSHTGKVKVKEAGVVLEGDAVKSAEVIVDMTSIANEDLTSAEYNKKLVDHLKSPDFFDVAAHPTAKLTLDKAEPVKGAGGTSDYVVTGTLTIKGTSKPVAFKATSNNVEGGAGRVVTADVVFDRTDYAIKYGSGKFFTNLGDKMIADEVKLSVELFLVPEKTSAER